MNKNELACRIDHTLLKATAVKADIIRVCEEAIQYGFASVCVNPKWVRLASEMLEGEKPAVCSVAGFPLGANSSEIKALEAKDAIFAGADEIDIVADIGAIIEGDRYRVVEDIQKVAAVCHGMKPKVTLKVIIEAAALTEEQIAMASEAANAAGADYVKTSTGLNPAGGASLEAVKIMKENAPQCKIKAAGGIRTTEEAIAMIEAGADRIGASASIAIVEGLEETQ